MAADFKQGQFSEEYRPSAQEDAISPDSFRLADGCLHLPPCHPTSLESFEGEFRGLPAELS